jgi:hypothetical protein
VAPLALDIGESRGLRLRHPNPPNLSYAPSRASPRSLTAGQASDPRSLPGLPLGAAPKAEVPTPTYSSSWSLVAPLQKKPLRLPRVAHRYVLYMHRCVWPPDVVLKRRRMTTDQRKLATGTLPFSPMGALRDANEP